MFTQRQTNESRIELGNKYCFGLIQADHTKFIYSKFLNKQCEVWILWLFIERLKMQILRQVLLLCQVVSNPHPTGCSLLVCIDICGMYFTHCSFDINKIIFTSQNLHIIIKTWFSNWVSIAIDDWFFPPNSRAILPTFRTSSPEGLILPRILPPTTVLYSAVTHHFWRYVRTQNTPCPSQNTPFPGLNLKIGKMNYGLGNFDPNWAKWVKSGQNLSRSGQIFLFICYSAFQSRQPKLC